MDVQALVAADPEHTVASAGRAVVRRRPLRHAVEAPVDLAAETGAFAYQERPPSVGARAARRIARCSASIERLCARDWQRSRSTSSDSTLRTSRLAVGKSHQTTGWHVGARQAE